jgi:hypothetical protein
MTLLALTSLSVRRTAVTLAPYPLLTHLRKYILNSLYSRSRTRTDLFLKQLSNTTPYTLQLATSSQNNYCRPRSGLLPTPGTRTPIPRPPMLPGLAKRQEQNARLVVSTPSRAPYTPYTPYTPSAPSAPRTRKTPGTKRLERNARNENALGQNARTKTPV